VGFKDKLAVRLDLINVSSQTIEIVSVEGLTPKYLKITNMPNCCSREDDGIIVHPKSLGPFKSVSVKLEYEPEKAGFFTFYPQIRYYDEQKIVKKSDLNAYVVSVIPPTGERKEITDADTSIEFGSSAAESAFQYLVRSFNNDLRQKTSVDKAGWRTLMDIARNTKVTKHSLYEFSHSKGKPLSELERLGLVESKYFLGERGRGGRVQKVRVVADNEAVRAHLRFKR
jgi:hypothetical protein